MFDTINGIPLHPLVVHVVVVLLPLAIVGAFAVVLRADWRDRYGMLVVAVAGLATLAIPVATSSGEALQSRVGNPGEHAELGDQLIWFALPLFVLLAAYVGMHRLVTHGTRLTTARPAAEPAVGLARRLVAGRGSTLVAGLTLVAALASGVQVYRVGDSGARAAWGHTSSGPAASSPGQVSGR